MAPFYGEEFLAPHPTLKLKEHPFSAVRYCTPSFPPYLWPFLHLQPEDASCFGDRDPLYMGEPAPWNFLTMEQLATHH
jgi:hypothetical protein